MFKIIKKIYNYIKVVSKLWIGYKTITTRPIHNTFNIPLYYILYTRISYFFLSIYYRGGKLMWQQVTSPILVGTYIHHLISPYTYMSQNLYIYICSSLDFRVIFSRIILFSAGETTAGDYCGHRISTESGVPWYYMFTHLNQTCSLHEYQFKTGNSKSSMK